jgi:hypothetical protein
MRGVPRFSLQAVWGPYAPFPSRTFRVVQVAHELSKGRVRTVRILRCSASCLGSFSRPSDVVPRAVRLAPAYCPPGHHRPSAPGFTDRLSLLLLELCFRIGLSWDLFLGWYVRWTIQPWQTCVGILGCEFGA